MNDILTIVFYSAIFIFTTCCFVCFWHYYKQYKSFIEKKYAYLTLFSKKWRIENTYPFIVYYNDKNIGILECFEMKGIKLIMKTDQWYKINVLTGEYHILEDYHQLKRVTQTTNLLFLFRIGVLNKLDTLKVYYFIMTLLCLLTYVFDKLVYTSIGTLLKYISFLPFIILTFYYVMMLTWEDRINEKRLQLSIVINDQQTRLQIIGNKSLILECHDEIIDNEMKIYFDNPGEYELKIYQKQTKLSMIQCFLYIILLPFQGIFYLLTMSFKPNWEEKIVPFCAKAKVLLNIEDDLDIVINFQESSYDKENHLWNKGKLSIMFYDVDVEYEANINDIKYCYYIYVKQLISIWIALLLIIGLMLYFYMTLLKLVFLFVGIIIFLILLIVVRYSVLLIRQEYKKMNKLYEDYKKEYKM